LLDVSDSAETGQFVTAVSETDGSISVSRAALQASDIPNLSTDKLTSGTLPVNRGGTGASTLTSGEVLIGNGTNAVTTKAIDTTVNANSSNLVTSGAVSAAISTATAGLTGAMHFIGISTTTITDGGIEDPTIGNTTVTEKAKGDVVLYQNGSKPIRQEYVWTGTAWELLGDEGSYAVKGSITNNDIDDNAAIAQTKIAGSTANTTLSDDLSSLAPKANPEFTGTVTIPVTPINNTDAASKKYVDDTAAAANTTYALTWNNKTATSDAEKLILTPSSGTV